VPIFYQNQHLERIFKGHWFWGYHGHPELWFDGAALPFSHSAQVASELCSVLTPSEFFTYVNKIVLDQYFNGLVLPKCFKYIGFIVSFSVWEAQIIRCFYISCYTSLCMCVCISIAKPSEWSYFG
jgi:hypothetical protein